MVLRLEHIEDVRTIGLSRFDDERTGRIVLAVHGEGSSGPVNIDAVLDQNVDEFDCRQEIRSIRRQNVSARIAHFRLAKFLIALHGQAAATAAASAATLRSGSSLAGLHGRRHRGHTPRRVRPTIRTAALD